MWLSVAAIASTVVTVWMVVHAWRTPPRPPDDDPIVDPYVVAHLRRHYPPEEDT